MTATTAIVARTGYTGEDGFELFVAPDGRARRSGAGSIEAGRPHGLLPAGLGARDTLRLEARMMLYGNDMDETTTLIEAGLGWIVSFDEAKGDFNGRAVLLEQKTSGAPRKLVGFETTERGIPRHGYPVFLGRRGDRAPSPRARFAPFLQKSIGLAYLPAARAGRGHRARGRDPRPPHRRARRADTVLQAPALEEAAMYPQDYRYTKDHEWIAVEGDRGRVGDHRLRPEAARRRRVRGAARGRAHARRRASSSARSSR